MAPPSSDLIAEFVAFTGVEDPAKAIQMLEATNNDIQAAVELYFAADAAADAGGGGPGSLGGAANPGDDPFGAYGAFGTGAAGNPSEDFGHEEPVRAPIPTKVDRLDGGGAHGGYDPRSRSRRAPPIDSHQPIMDAFRARREEGMVGSAGMAGSLGRVDAGNAAAGAAGRGGASSSGNNQKKHDVDAHWSDQFSPPRDLLFKDGDCQDAAEFAQQSKQWLLVNIQSPSSFDSHRLNRDTWKDPAMGAMLPVSFVFYQTYDVREEGQILASMWGCDSFPVTLVVDPVTQAVMRTWNGFVRADALIEELVPFMDTSFDDPGASRLAAASFRKKSKAMGVNVPAADGGDGGDGAVAPSRGGAPPPQPDTTMDTVFPEDSSDRSSPQQQRSSVLERLPSSLPTTGPPTRQPSTALPPAGADEAAAAAAETAQKEANETLPDEPEDGSSCRVALRLPDGTRTRRRFPSDAPLGVLKTWCVSLSLEAARGREFVLAEAVPGATAIRLDDAGTIGGAGIDGSMLALKWSD